MNLYSYYFLLQPNLAQDDDKVTFRIFGSPENCDRAELLIRSQIVSFIEIYNNMHACAHYIVV